MDQLKAKKKALKLNKKAKKGILVSTNDKKSQLLNFVEKEKSRIKTNLLNKKYTDVSKKKGAKSYLKSIKEMKKLVLVKRSMKSKKSSKSNLKKLNIIVKKQVSIINKWMIRLSQKKKSDSKMKEQLSKKLIALESELKAIKDFQTQVKVQK